MEENGYFIIVRGACMMIRFHLMLAIIEDSLQRDQNLCSYKVLDCVVNYSLCLEEHNLHWHFIEKMDYDRLWTLCLDNLNSNTKEVSILNLIHNLF